MFKEEAAKWQREPPAEEHELQKLIEQCGIELPNAYLDLLRYSNGGEGELGIEPGWFQLWPVEEVIALNQSYEVQTNIPAFWGFGSSGGGELLAFDVRTSKSVKVFMIPFIPMDEKEAVKIADDFESFVKEMGRRSDSL